MNKFQMLQVTFQPGTKEKLSWRYVKIKLAKTLMLPLGQPLFGSQTTIRITV